MRDNENDKCCGKSSRQASVSIAFSSSPKLPRVFLDRNTENILTISFRKFHDKKKKTGKKLVYNAQVLP